MPPNFHETSGLKTSRKRMIKRFLLIFLPIWAVGTAIMAGFLRQELQAEMKILRASQRQKVDLLHDFIITDLKSISTDLLVTTTYSELHKMLNDYRGGPKDTLAAVLLAFSKNKGIYDQVRFLDHEGQEVVRIDYDAGQAYITPSEELQNQAQRYYFLDTLVLPRGQIFMSPLDLNVEHGVIEQPPKPVIRFGTPVFDATGRKRGIMLLNYLASNLLHRLEEISGRAQGQLMLLNNQGYWLKGPRPQEEWGFMYKDRRHLSFAQRHPRAWRAINSRERGQFLGGQGLVTYETVHPLKENVISSTGSGTARGASAATVVGKDYFWKIISVLPPEDLQAYKWQVEAGWVWIYAVVVVLLGLSSGFLAVLGVRRKEAEEQRELVIGQLQKAQEELKRLAALDGLTGVANRRQFDEVLAKEWQRARRNGQPLGLVIADIDHFKLYNDAHGHLAGDDCLRQVSRALERALRRPGDTLARYGGEEFAAILPNTDAQGAGRVAEAMRQAVMNADIAHGDSVVAPVVTVSLGGASSDLGGYAKPKDLVKAADQALYRAKDQGRNQVAMADHG